MTRNFLLFLIPVIFVFVGLALIEPTEKPQTASIKNIIQSSVDFSIEDQGSIIYGVDPNDGVIID